MKKLAMMLVLALCLMTAATAMADFTIRADVKGFGHNSSYNEEELANDYQLSFSSGDSTWFKEDWGTDILSYSDEPQGMQEAQLAQMLKEEMLKAMEAYFDGEFNYALYDVEAKVMYGRDNEYWSMDVPKRRDDRPGLWASSATGTVGNEHFGGAVDKVVALYATFSGYGNPPTLTIQPVESAKIVDGGVEMTFTHLSPVMIAWTNKPIAAPLQPPVEGLPQTGDNSSLPGLFILLGMSVAAFGAMKLRREN